MTELTVTKTVLLKNLPALLKKLVVGTGVRPTKVRVTFTSGVPTVTSNWRTHAIVGLGTETVLPTEHWMGDDGESNSSTDVTFSVAAVATWTKCGSTSPSGASIVIGGLTPALKEALEAGVFDVPSPFAVSALTVALDAALERPSEPVAEPYTLVDWLAACA